MLWTVSGCSHDEIPDHPEFDATNKESKVEITFDVNVDAGAQTRSQRPLESSDDWQRISDMRIYVFRSTTGGDDNRTYTYYKPDVYDGTTETAISKKDYFYVAPFGGKGDVIWGQNGETDEEHSYSINPLLPTGYYYKFLAIGRDDVTEADHSEIVLTDPNLNFTDGYPEEFVNHINQLDEGGISSDYSIQWEEGQTTLDKALLRSSQYQAAEVFSGCSGSIHVTDDEKVFQEQIESRRMVAGILLYVENVPAQATAMATITSSNAGNEELIKKGNTYPVDAVGIVPVTYSKDVTVVDRTPAGNTALNYSTENIPFATPYVRAYTQNADGRHRLLAGSFIIPQGAPDKSLTIGSEEWGNTLYLVYYTNGAKTGENQKIPISWHIIKCTTDDIPATSGNETTSHQGDAYKFPLYANQIYCLGRKNQTEDQPIDLSKVGAEITIQIDPFWNEYYGGVLDGSPSDGIGIDPDWGEHPSGTLQEDNSNHN
ncbi:MAG: hypothetical protein LUC45_00775 [Paraprevotella sp.]|nr:hypothetical protein [Paraprevotella sp.]